MTDNKSMDEIHKIISYSITKRNKELREIWNKINEDPAVTSESKKIFKSLLFPPEIPIITKEGLMEDLKEKTKTNI
jgi:hypothetical protein